VAPVGSRGEAAGQGQRRSRMHSFLTSHGCGKFALVAVFCNVHMLNNMLRNLFGLILHTLLINLQLLVYC